MRIKFPDQPEKFMDSEIDLHEALQVGTLYDTVFASCVRSCCLFNKKIVKLVGVGCSGDSTGSVPLACGTEMCQFSS